MSKFQRLNVLNTIVEVGLIPLFYHKDAEVAIKIIDACLEGGARCIEFTNRGDGAHRVFEKIITYYENHSNLILGCGSIIDPATASLYIQIGANFVVGPTLNEDIAYLCNQRKIAYIPGCGNVNDISQAEKLGVEICKYFPGTIGGPEFVKNILGPMPWSRIMPTGGVSLEEKNITEWFKAGVTAVGIGSNLIPKEAITRQDYLTITKNVKQVLDWISSVRKTK
jgi:2-dehydro-3-deoxyphosphogluconate aldolase/(4S)-4-hydroxy-2-oxoglutarate aldolase